MPEATVYKYYRAVFGKNDIGFAGELFCMQSVTIAICMQEFTNEHFGLGVLALYPAHIIAAGRLIVHIGHKTKLNIIPNDERCQRLRCQIAILQVGKKAIYTVCQ